MCSAQGSMAGVVGIQVYAVLRHSHFFLPCLCLAVYAMPRTQWRNAMSCTQCMYAMPCAEAEAKAELKANANGAKLKEKRKEKPKEKLKEKL